MLKKLKSFINSILFHMKKPEMLTLPASLAYYFVLAIVPIMSLLLIIATNLSIPTDIVTDFFQNNFSDEIVQLITPIIYSKGLSLGYITYLMIAFFLVSNGSDAIIVATNTIFNIKNQQFLKRRLKAFLLTIVLFILLTFILIVPVFGEQLLYLLNIFKINSIVFKTVKVLYPVLNIPITFIIIYLCIKLIYLIAPDEKIKSEYVTKGSLFTTAGWVIATVAYSYYIKHFAEYNLYYSGLSSLVILMVWFYILAFIFVIGLSMNYNKTEIEIERTNTIKLKEIEEKIKSFKSQ